MKSTIFSILALFTFYKLIDIYGLIPTSIHTMLIILIAAIGENYASGRNFYFYNKNSTKHWVKRVPFYILPFWIFFIQAPLLIYSFFTSGLLLVIFSSITTMMLDVIFVEPIMCKKMNLWIWVKNKKTPLSKLNNYNKTPAPIGNYVIWLTFPFIVNLILLCL